MPAFHWVSRAKQQKAKRPMPLAQEHRCPSKTSRRASSPSTSNRSMDMRSLNAFASEVAFGSASISQGRGERTDQSRGSLPTGRIPDQQWQMTDPPWQMADPPWQTADASSQNWQREDECTPSFLPTSTMPLSWQTGPIQQHKSPLRYNSIEWDDCHVTDMNTMSHTPLLNTPSLNFGRRSEESFGRRGEARSRYEVEPITELFPSRSQFFETRHGSAAPLVRRFVLDDAVASSELYPRDTALGSRPRFGSSANFELQANSVFERATSKTPVVLSDGFADDRFGSPGLSGYGLQDRLASPFGAHRASTIQSTMQSTMQWPQLTGWQRGASREATSPTRLRIAPLTPPRGEPSSALLPEPPSAPLPPLILQQLLQKNPSVLTEPSQPEVPQPIMPQRMGSPSCAAPCCADPLVCNVHGEPSPKPSPKPSPYLSTAAHVGLEGIKELDEEKHFSPVPCVAVAAPCCSTLMHAAAPDSLLITSPRQAATVQPCRSDNSKEVAPQALGAPTTVGIPAADEEVDAQKGLMPTLVASDETLAHATVATGADVHPERVQPELGARADSPRPDLRPGEDTEEEVLEDTQEEGHDELTEEGMAQAGINMEYGSFIPGGSSETQPRSQLSHLKKGSHSPASHQLGTDTATQAGAVMVEKAVQATELADSGGGEALPFLSRFW